METILEFENVSYHYLDGSSNVTILDKANYSFQKGKIYAIVGASGSGKTTTIILAGGLDKPKSGRVLFKGTDTAKIGLNKYRRNNISIVFQSYNLIHYMNAYENVVNAIEIAGIKISNKKEYCLKILNDLGLSKEQCLRDIRKLSGGQQQRVAIARAIAKDVDLILADEPTGNLDEKNSREILKAFIELAHNNNKCVIIVTHSPSLANKCDVQLKINDGQIIEI
ncbi:ABC transporter ATP-binding protein [Thomasclavelia saccharogumia]|uniref:ABC transporter ATP-binding protein n=1 Tax=Thomasclavelia saccharogumia TaxID=341225 RepID=UPI000479D620|nr:ABC transporter ATP-binding protein [Thomasclavelia saccharogumia]